MSAEITFLLGQLAIGDKVCVDTLKEQATIEDYIQFKCRNPGGRDVRYLISGVTNLRIKK